MIRPSLVTLLILISFAPWAWAGENASADDVLTYEQHIRPIFRAYCFDCHGANDELSGGLDLRLVRFMLRGGESGAAISPGQPNESLFLQRIIAGEMPPGQHRVADDAMETLKQWVQQGAKTARPEPDSIPAGLGITFEERSYWAFQPPQRPQIESAAPSSIAAQEATARIRNPIDALALEQMGVESGSFEPDAERETLIKRVYFDLIGLPPPIDQVERWASDTNPDWYDRLLTELLESPHYGERWARHWLDVAGYADSDGYTLGDAERPWAWKYRDWVIRSLNDDKPFDQFIIEQLAGDELAGPLNGDLTEQQIELLTATGFLRMAADGTGSGADHDEARNQVMIDTLKIVGTSLMGLSIHCAQCHDHRYDPIPQADYYALRAVFEPALDWKSWKTPSQRLVSLYTSADREQAAAIEVQAQAIEQERNLRQSEYMKQALDAELMKYDEPLKSSLQMAYQTPANERSEDQKQLLAANPSVNITPGNLYQYIPESKTQLDQINQRIADVRATKPVEPFIRALVETPGHVPDTKLFHRGDFNQPQQSVLPSALQVATPADRIIQFPVDDPEVPSTGRRLAFAKWLTDRGNPLLSRVIVNRVWMHHFGTGLVPTPGEFGKLGALPSDERLLDWLACEFMDAGWSMKQLHRTILSSTLWRQRVVPASLNPYARSLRRLEAEIIRDSMLTATGELDPALFGPPIKIVEDETGQVVVDGSANRRSLYVQSRRSRPVALLQTFDAPVMETNCDHRVHSTVATQSLMLLNSGFILDRSAKLADRTAREAVAVTDSLRAKLPAIPEPRTGQWQYGYGHFQSESAQTNFTPFPHWNGQQWSGGESLPDVALGWAFLNAIGGHPDIAQRGVIRRWTVADNGAIELAGKLTHPSEHGDGVQGQIVSSRSGVIGNWQVAHGAVDTQIERIQVVAGESIDIITSCRADQTSDSFTWPITITFIANDGARQANVSVDQFGGPMESIDQLPGQVIRAWQLVYSRSPSEDELIFAIDFLGNQIRMMNTNPQAIPAGRTSLRQAMTNLCQSLLSSNEFLYVE